MKEIGKGVGERAVGGDKKRWGRSKLREFERKSSE